MPARGSSSSPLPSGGRPRPPPAPARRGGGGARGAPAAGPVWGGEGGTAEGAQVVELVEAEAGGVDRGHVGAVEGRPAAGGGLAGLGPVQDVGRGGLAGAQPGEAGAVHGVAVGDYVTDRGIKVGH